MYSRSYGITEDGGNRPFRIPPDYNGNACKREAADDVPKKETETVAEKPPSQEESPFGFLEKLTAEDILLFVFVYAMLRGDTKRSDILGIVLALLLL